jgi:hypothetical protein
MDRKWQTRPVRVETRMKLVAEYLADAAKFDELARLEQNPELRN